MAFVIIYIRNKYDLYFFFFFFEMVAIEMNP